MMKETTEEKTTPPQVVLSCSSAYDQIAPYSLRDDVFNSLRGLTTVIKCTFRWDCFIALLLDVYNLLWTWTFWVSSQHRENEKHNFLSNKKKAECHSFQRKRKQLVREVQRIWKCKIRVSQRGGGGGEGHRDTEEGDLNQGRRSFLLKCCDLVTEDKSWLNETLWLAC